MELSKLIDECHNIAVSKGWWEEQRDFPTVVMLVVTELSEAVQEDRKINGNRFYNTKVEIADAFIRLFDMCGAYFPDIESTILENMDTNRYRPYKHNRRY